MDNLIKKAIEAIKEDKKDYAIGLLEGVLTLNGYKDNVNPVYPVNVSTPTYTVSTGTPLDAESMIITSTAASKIEDIKKIAEESSV